MSRRKNIRIREPSPEILLKVRRARDAIANQTSRSLKCPYCQHNSFVVFEDTRGHVQTKCDICGNEVVFDVINMRRLRFYDSEMNR